MDSVYDASFDALTALRFGRYSEAYARRTPLTAILPCADLRRCILDATRRPPRSATRSIAESSAGGYLPQLFLAREAEANGRFAEARAWIADAVRNQQADFSGELIPFFARAGGAGVFRAAPRRWCRSGRSLHANARALSERSARALRFSLRACGRRPERGGCAMRARFMREWEGADTRLDGADLP